VRTAGSLPLAAVRIGAAARLVALALATTLLLWPQAVAEPTFSADAVEAAYLYRFAAYVHWPEQSGGDAPFGIGVVDAEGVVDALEKLLPGLSVQHRPTRVVRVATASDLAQVQILYVGAAARHRALIDAAAHRPILLVLDQDNGLSLGAVINFLHVGHNLRFEVSLPAAARSGLKIDSDLLSVAEHVERGPRAELGCAPGSSRGSGLCTHGVALAAADDAAPLAHESSFFSGTLGRE
jgi:YfiR/HmsC-like